MARARYWLNTTISIVSRLASADPALRDSRRQTRVMQQLKLALTAQQARTPDPGFARPPARPVDPEIFCPSPRCPPTSMAFYPTTTLRPSSVSASLARSAGRLQHQPRLAGSSDQMNAFLLRPWPGVAGLERQSTMHRVSATPRPGLYPPV